MAMVIDDKRDYFGFNGYVGGCFKFAGVLSNGKEIDNIEASIDEEKATVAVKITYSDKNIKRFESAYVFSDSDNVVTLSNIKKYWNDIQIGGETNE